MLEHADEEDLWVNEFYLYFRIVCRLCNAEAGYEDCWDEFELGRNNEAVAMMYAQKAATQAKKDGWVLRTDKYNSNFLCLKCAST